MNADTFFEAFDLLAEAPNSVAKLRELILQLAVQGKLVSQDHNDEPAATLLDKIRAKRMPLIEIGIISESPHAPDETLSLTPHSIPDGWVWVRLADLGGFIGGGTPSKDQPEYWNGDIPWVSPKDMKVPYIRDAIDHVSKIGVDQSSAKMIPKGSLLMVVRGMILAHSFPVALTEREVTINQDMKSLCLASQEISEYLLRCCQASRDRVLAGVERSSHGTCRIPTEILANFLIPLPPLAEQRRIVAKVDELLGLCDELETRQGARRELRERLVQAALDQLLASRDAAEFERHWKRIQNHFDILFNTPEAVGRLQRAIMHLAVVGILVDQRPKDRSAGLLLADIRTALEKGTKSERNGNVEHINDFVIPKSWEWARLADLATVMDSGWSPACDDEPTGSENEWGVLKTTAVQELEFLVHEHKRLPANLEPRPGAEVKSGDILITRAGPKNRVGICCLVPEIRRRLMLSDKIIRIHFVDDLLCREFMALCLNAGPSKEYLERVKSGMAESQMNVSQVKLRDTPIAIPPLAEQYRIIAKVRELVSICRDLERNLVLQSCNSERLIVAAVKDLLATESNPKKPSKATESRLSASDRQRAIVASPYCR